MRRADVPGNATGLGTLIEIRMGKAHCEGAHLVLAGGQRGDEARIESSRKQQANRYVSNQMLRRHLLKRGPELLFDIARLGVSVPRDLRAEVALELRFLVRTHAQKMPRRQFTHAVQDSAAILERISEFQELTNRAAIERRLKPREYQQSFEF